MNPTPSCCGSSPEATNDTKAIVRETYGSLARDIAQGVASSCCSSPASAAQQLGAEAICADLYLAGQLSELPEEAILASLGCGNPTALAHLEAGQIVLDLGSGGGIDVLLSARRVGPTGKAYGLDMTDEMLELARSNQRKAGIENVEFLRGEIENIPLPDRSVDVIISNCVINLSSNKQRVLQEAYRVLKPGGQLAISDIVTRTSLPLEIRQSLELWVGCVAGALPQDEYRQALETVGFQHIDIEPTRFYTAQDAQGLMKQTGTAIDPQLLQAIDGQLFAGFIRARKPQPEPGPS